MSGYYHQLDQVWPSGQVIPIPVEPGQAFGEVSRLNKLGALEAGGKDGQGDAPFRKIALRRQHENRHRRDQIADDDPGNHNSDSFGYNDNELGAKQDS